MFLNIKKLPQAETSCTPGVRLCCHYPSKVTAQWVFTNRYILVYRQISNIFTAHIHIFNGQYIISIKNSFTIHMPYGYIPGWNVRDTCFFNGICAVKYFMAMYCLSEYN